MAGKVAAQNGLVRITRVVVAVGGLSGVEPASLEFAFQVLSKGSPAEGAELALQLVPILAQCGRCESQYAAEPDDLACPNCEGGRVEILQGRELTLLTITGERDDESHN